jgi:hypothetical protein
MARKLYRETCDVNSKPIVRRQTTARPHTTRAVEQAARAALEAHGHFRGRADQFEMTALADALVVWGAVPTFYLKQVLQTTLMKVEGVVRVHNRVDVVNSRGLSTTPDSAARNADDRGRSTESWSEILY